MKNHKLKIAPIALAMAVSVTAHAQQISRRPVVDSTGNRTSAVAILPTQQSAPLTAAQIKNIAGDVYITNTNGNGMPPGYVERTITQNLGPYFVVPGFAYPNENQVNSVNAMVPGTSDPYSGYTVVPTTYPNVTAMSYCGGVYDGRTVSVPVGWGVYIDGGSVALNQSPQYVGYLNGMSSLGYVSQITQVVCAQLGARTVTTLERIDSSSSPTKNIDRSGWESLRQSIGSDVLGVSSANQICIWAGYPKGMVPGSIVDGGSWYTCGNNTVGIYQNGAWVRANACADNSKLMSVTCLK